MSRTYRRKGKSPLWVTMDWVFVDGYFMRVKMPDRVCRYELAKYHSDSYDPYTPSREFRRVYGHKHDRAKTRKALRKELYAIEHGNVIFEKTTNIDWQWW